MRQKTLTVAIYGLTSAIGVLAFIYPFLVPSLRSAAQGQAHSNDAPLMLTALVGLCFVVLLLEVQGQGVNAKFVALLGVLVSINSVLRFLEVAIPGPGGISPIFFLIVLTGYVYGARFGFLMGVLTMLVSALITGSAGPWLPYQMFTAGWIGLSAPLCRPLARFGARILSTVSAHPKSKSQNLEVVILAIFGGLWGFVFGGIMNVWFWPFALGPADYYWEAGISLGDTLRRYAAFYLATSLVWDALRATGTVLLTLAFGVPTLRALRRFQRRFAFSYRPSYRSEASSPLGQASGELANSSVNARAGVVREAVSR